MTSLVVRTFESSDINAALQLWTDSPGVGLGLSDTAEELARFLKRNTGLSWVATKGETLVGAVLAGHDGRRGTLYHLAVEPTHWRQGIGRKLVNASLVGLHRAGIPRVTIHVFAHNQAGINFWHSVGWTDRSDLSVIQFNVPPPLTL